MTYRHVVLFRIHDHVEDHDIDAAIEALRSLADLPRVESWRIARSLDERKGRIIVEEASFADESAFAAFRTDPRHRDVAAEMATISDWWVGDYRDGSNRSRSAADPGHMGSGSAETSK